jgi:O-antigen ligase
MISKAILILILIDLILPGLRPLQQWLGTKALGINGLVFKYYPAFAVSIIMLTQGVPGVSKTWRLLSLVVSVLVIVRSVMFQTRSAWLALIVVSILFLIRIPRRTVLIFVFIIGISIGGIFFSNVLQYNLQVSQRVVFALQSNNERLASEDDRIRIVAYHFGWRMFTERPVFGWGPDSFADLIRHYAPASRKYITGGAFNSWLMLMVETGTIGLVPVLLAFLLPFWIVWNRFSKVPEYIRYLAIAFTLGVIGTGVHLLFIDLMYTSQVWFHVGFGMAAANIIFQEKDMPYLLQAKMQSVR